MSKRQIITLVLFATVPIACLCVFRLRAQDATTSAATPAKGASVQDALHRPFDFPFSKPTRLDEVAKVLSKALNAPVALDRAALARQDVQDDDEVQLDLRNIRLKTGLKLLLDQLDLTFRVEAEDNLLIITDLFGSVDPVDQVLVEIKSLHKDVHSLQDSIEEIRNAMGLDDEGGPKMRKPTIIEEIPGDGKEKPKSKEIPSTTSPARTRAGI